MSAADRRDGNPTVAAGLRHPAGSASTPIARQGANGTFDARPPAGHGSCLYTRSGPSAGARQHTGVR